MSRVAVGFSEARDPLEAASEAASGARAGLGGSCDLCLVFASADHLPAAAPVLSVIGEALAPRHLIGCGAGGTLAAGREVEGGPGLAVWAAELPECRLETFHLTAQREDGELSLTGLPPDLGPPGEDAAVILLADPYSFPSELLLAELERSRPGTPVLGGLASAAVDGGSVLMRGGEVHTDGAVAVLVSGLQVLPCVSQGATPIGPEMTITAAEGNVIRELASVPAMERIAEALGSLGDHEQALAARGLLIGIVIDENRPSYERGDFLVRPIAGADRSSGTIAIGEPVRIGQSVRLHVRDAASADEDLRSALRDQVEALGDEGAAG
ncbi:MAG: FIST C-terminal domain-containing protein, partial [Actinomycetota bacterium]|nr:FIST C-terminal domain-containing protein [Actinomycetota bacterium]